MPGPWPLGEAMRRREFITLVSGAAIVCPLSALAQQSRKLPTIGYLGVAPYESDWLAAFEERLTELGWVKGRTIEIEYRSSEGRPERIAEFAAEFVQQKVDVIVTIGGAVAIVKRATTSIPIVFAIALDPVGIGIVTSFSHPGGNVTGLSIQQAENASKRLELLRQALPGLRRLAVLFDASYPATVREGDYVRAAAQQLGLEVMLHGVQRAEDIPTVLSALKGQADALYIVESALTNTNRARIITLAIDIKLPTTANTSDFARAGALMSYGPNISSLYRRAADYVDKILRGAKPGDIPVEQPTKFDLVFNLKTAKALGLTIPHNLLVLADEVIE
jgi:putative tryptophan/tyrosine transport system substrate-binding protein